MSKATDETKGKQQLIQNKDIYPEDIFSEKLDLCLTDTAIKTGAGIMIGGLTSLLFFRMRRWPIIAGMGIGIGLAWANCEHELNQQTQKHT